MEPQSECGDRRGGEAGGGVEINVVAWRLAWWRLVFGGGGVVASF